MDEAAFVSLTFFNQVIVPLLGVKSTKLILLTTPPPDEHNYFSILLKCKVPGTDRNAFGNLIVDLACQTCKNKNRESQCKHKFHLLPKWKGSDKFILTATLFGDAHVNDHLRENMGITTSAKDKMFESGHIDDFEKKKKWNYVSPQTILQHVFVSIDPNAGGENEFAIVSLAVVHGVFVV